MVFTSMDSKKEKLEKKLNSKLYLAAYNGKLKEVKELLDSDANVHYPDFLGSTPCYIAARNGHTPVVKLLLDKGADANIPNNYGTTPCHNAALNGHLDTVKLPDPHCASLSLDDDGASR